MSSMTQPYDIYRTHMVEFKLRLNHAERIASAKSPITGLSALDAEFCFLQIRRLIELITFSAALRDEGRYKRLRELQRIENQRDHGDHSKDWEAPEILKRLSEISLHSLPIPIKRIGQLGTSELQIDLVDVSVTHGRLIEIYKKCGGYLHARNPLGKDFARLVEVERKKYEGAHAEIRRCLAFFRKLMWHHAAISLDWSDELNPRDLADPRAAWLVDFGGEGTQEVSMTLADAK